MTDAELVLQLLILAPMSVGLWYGVVKWVRYLNTIDLLESLRPTHADLHRIARTEPKMVLR